MTIIKYNILKHVNKPKIDWSGLSVSYNMLGVEASKAGEGLREVLLNLDKLNNSKKTKLWQKIVNLLMK